MALDVASSHEDRVRFFVPHSGISGPEEVKPEDMGFTLHEGRLLHMSSIIDMENSVTIGCAGAVLTHLQRRRATGMSAMQMGNTAFRVRFLQMFSLCDTMSAAIIRILLCVMLNYSIRWISNNTFLSLQIIQSESHPNMFNQGPGSKSASGKESLSIFGLFRRFAYTPQGRAKLKQIFFRPSLNIDTIRERHDFIDVFSRPDNMAALEKMTKALKHIKNLRPVMINLRKGVSTGSGKIMGFKTTVWASLLAVSFALLGLTICS